MTEEQISKVASEQFYKAGLHLRRNMDPILDDDGDPRGGFALWLMLALAIGAGVAFAVIFVTSALHVHWRCLLP